MKLAVLAERGAHGRGPQPTSPADRPTRRREPATLNEVLDELASKVEKDDTAGSVTLGKILQSVGRRSYGPLLLVIGLLAISPATVIPGMTWLAAALTLLVAGQKVLWLGTIWLRRKALSAAVKRESVQAGVERARGLARIVDRLLKPRLQFLNGLPFVNLIALLSIGAGLIPFAPLAPGIAVVAFGLGKTARDGLWLPLGSAFVAGVFLRAAQVVF